MSGGEGGISTAVITRVDALEARLKAGGFDQGGPPPQQPPTDRTEHQLVRTEKGSDGVLRLYRRLEHRFPNNDVYVGETVHGRREGRGTYYYRNGDVYVGEFRDNLFHGVGVLRKGDFKECGRACSGRSYQGEFVGGLRQGKGKFATGFGDLYEGDFSEDAYHGRGVMVYQCGDRYEGGWVRGKREGRGVCRYANGDVYEGGWYRGQYHGEGSLQYKKSKGGYSGSWVLGKKQGIGKRLYGSGAEYEGEWVRDARCGKGVGKTAMGDLYVGGWLDDLYHGEGSLIFCTGDRYQGEFARGKFCGVGHYEYQGGGYYDGEYKAELRMGVAASGSDRWFWRAWKRMPKTHIYDPLTGELLLVRGKAPVKGEPVEAEIRDPKHYLPSQRLQFAMEAMTEKEEASRQDRLVFEKNSAELSGAARKKALERFEKKFGKKPTDFRPPIIVGTPRDEQYLAAGGQGDGVLKLAADGLRHGKGVRVYGDGSRYEGGWVQDKRVGFGVFVGGGALGARYEGEWQGDVRHGVGVESYGNTTGGVFTCPLLRVHSGGGRCFYDGGWVGGYYEGEGTFTCCNGVQYHGAWSHGKRHGFGRMVMYPKQQQYSVARGVDGEVTLHNTAAVGEFGQGLTLDDAYRIRVFEGFFDKNKRMGIGRETLNRGEVREGIFEYGKLNGVVRITFPPTKPGAKPNVSFANFYYNVRKGWIKGARLRDLEDLWYEEVMEQIERESRQDRVLATLSKYGMFKIKDIVKAKEDLKAIRDSIDKEETEKEEEGKDTKAAKALKANRDDTPAEKRWQALAQFFLK